MASSEPNHLELVISNYVRNNYEDKYNQAHIPIALKYIIMKFSEKIIPSKLLTMPQDFCFFELLKLELQNIKHFQLLFRASDHDYSIKKFHTQCVDKGATILICKNNHGNIYGGYTSKA